MTQSQVHILVVDDERNIRNNLGMVLEADGHKVDTASNGDDALLRRTLRYSVHRYPDAQDGWSGTTLLCTRSQTQHAGGHVDRVRDREWGGVTIWLWRRALRLRRRMKFSSGWGTPRARDRRRESKPMCIITISHDAFGDGCVVAERVVAILGYRCISRSAG
jgi:hypothetical protein